MFSWLKSWWVNFWGIARIDPRVVTCASKEDAAAKAIADAGALAACATFECAPTGSMAPLIPTWGAWVIGKYQPVSAARLGTIAIYNAQWFTKTPLCHRLVQRDSLGFIASGDSNASSEPSERVTAQNYLAEVVTIYTWPKGVE